MSITIHQTITLTESEARTLWEEHNSQQDTPATETPIGQELADWVADKAMTDLESQWQDESGVFASTSADAETDTAALLQEIILCDYVMKYEANDPSELREAEEHRSQYMEELGITDLPENQENELNGMLKDYNLDKMPLEDVKSLFKTKSAHIKQ